MKKVWVFAVVISLMVCFFLFRVLSEPNEVKDVGARIVSGKLQATITLSQPVVWSNEHGQLHISYKLINQSNETVDTKFESAQLLLNGAAFRRDAPAGWVGMVPMNAHALPAGGSIEYKSKQTFKPGDYTLRWEGDDFISPLVKLRVY